MDNNKMFIFMIVLGATFIIMNLYFYYTKPAQQQTVNTDASSDMFAQTTYGSGTESEQTDNQISNKDRWEIIDKDDTYSDEDLVYVNGKIHIEFTPYGGELKQAIIINGNKNAKPMQD